MANSQRLDYRKRKELKAVLIAKAGDDHVLVMKRFDPMSGVEQQPETHALSLAQLEAERLQVLEDLEEYDAIIADVKATKLNYFDLLKQAMGGKDEPAPARDSKDK